MEAKDGVDGVLGALEEAQDPVMHLHDASGPLQFPMERLTAISGKKDQISLARGSSRDRGERNRFRWLKGQGKIGGKRGPKGPEEKNYSARTSESLEGRITPEVRTWTLRGLTPERLCLPHQG